MYFCQKCQRGSYIDRDKLENEVVKVFKLIKFSPQYVEKIITRAKELVNEYHTTQDSERTRLAREKNKIERGMKDAEEDRFINKTLDASMFAQVYANLQARLKGVDDQLTNSHVDHSKKIQVLDKVLTLAENIGEAYKMADYPLQRGYLALFIKKLNIKRGKIVSYELSDALKSLIAKDVVLVRKNGLPGEDSNL